MPVLVHFFFTAAHFHLALVTPTISHLVTAARLQNFYVVLPTKTRSRSLSPFFSLSFAGLPLTFSFSLSYSFALYSKLVDMTINVRIQRQFPVSAFVFSCLCFIRRE